MTIHEQRRTDPVAPHAYTVPVVREVPIRHGSGPPSPAPYDLEQRLAYAADSQAW
jgi:hypothetical protein